MAQAQAAQAICINSASSDSASKRCFLNTSGSIVYVSDLIVPSSFSIPRFGHDFIYYYYVDRSIVCLLHAPNVSGWNPNDECPSSKT